jgi:hypothetical protein
MAKTIFEEMSGTYVRQGDYFIPDLKLPEEETKFIGIWGQRHAKYLKQNHKLLYTNLLTGGKLNKYLVTVNEQANDMFLRLVDQFAKKENVTEKLKAENPMIWVQKMNNIRSRVTDIINTDIIFS